MERPPNRSYNSMAFEPPSEALALSRRLQQQLHRPQPRPLLKKRRPKGGGGRRPEGKAEMDDDVYEMYRWVSRW